MKRDDFELDEGLLCAVRMNSLKTLRRVYLEGEKQMLYCIEIFKCSSMLCKQKAHSNDR